MPAAETPIPTSALPATKRKFRLLPSAETVRASRFLIKDAVWRYRLPVLGIVLLGFLAPFLQAALFLILFGIVKSGASGTIKFQIFNWTAHFELLPEQVVASAIGVALALGVVAWMIYFVKHASLGLAERYQMYSGKQALALLFTREEVAVPSDCTMPLRQYLSRAIRLDSRLTGRCFAQLLYVPVPLISLVVYFCVLLYLDPRLTVVLALIMPLVGIAQMVVIRRAAFISEETDTLGSKVNGELGEIISARYCSTSNVRNPDKFLDDALMGDSHYRNFISMRMEMLLLPARSQVINDIFSAITIAIVIGAFAWGTGFKVTRLAEIAAYLVVLRMVSVNAKSVAGVITVLNKFMPQTRRYIDFILNNPINEADTRKILPAPPALISLLMLEDLFRYNASHVASLVLGITGDETSRIHAALIDPHTLAPAQVPARGVLDLDEDVKVRDLVRSTWGAEAASTLPDGLESATCGEVLEKLSARQLLQVLIAAELSRTPTLLYLKEEDLSSLSPEEIAEILKISSHVATIVVHDAPFRRLGALGESRFVVIQEDQIAGDFNPSEFQARRRELLSEFREARAKKRAADKRSGIEEDDDLESGGF